MLVATVDTNVLVSAFLTPGSAPGEVVSAAQRGAFRLALSDYILNELSLVLERPYFAARVPIARQTTGFDALRVIAVMVVPEPSVRGVSRDPKDDPVLGTAVAANAAYLVTGDADLLMLGRYGAVAIVAPRPFLTLLDLVNQAAEENELAADG
jgi:uncharacterized protein